MAQEIRESADRVAITLREARSALDQKLFDDAAEAAEEIFAIAQGLLEETD